MGLCLCKDRSSSSETTTCCGCTSLNCPCCFRWGKIRGGGSRDSAANGGGRVTSGHNRDTLGSDRTTSSAASDPNFLITHLSPPLVDSYVLETLKILRTLVGNDAEAPSSMVKLHRIAELEEGWLMVVTSLVNSIPMNDPLGPAVISLLLDDCPLPTKENAMQLSKHLRLSNHTNYDVRQKRNICIVLGCLAEKLAGQNSTILLNDEVMNYLISQLNPTVNPAIILFAIIALEKFAQTSENKTVIMKSIQSTSENPLLKLESMADSEIYDQRQVGFCSQWSLDNIFMIPSRPFGYEMVDNSGINVILNSYDVSEYLKISPSGLEARCDASSFESVRSTFQVDSGTWYYEVLIITEGVMQIGWATKASKFLNHEGYGIGDDEFSVAYDGCRQVMWQAAQSEPMSTPCWKPGDILGTYLDLEKFEMIFYLNGALIKIHTDVFKHTKSGFFAAGSFMSFQQCEFNFGSRPFKFPPKGKHFKNFNQYAKLGDECRVVLPRHLKMEYLRKVSVKENSCNLCYDHIANVRLLPCEHCGFCNTCADQLESCPLCRKVIENKITLFEA
ncbi:RING finger and SPRY domain-containing protein 1 [Folsomia candida]|nr:RING finger and SPRY domain-containing protein 1 [Folsomia candida]XP_035712723.1 RING finger and SPRY domain-containing protein 1 [Folsomia candida]XP_035712724.1 RING finger and SPRY domain-containing protein 1 [Folsomia candida]